MIFNEIGKFVSKQGLKTPDHEPNTPSIQMSISKTTSSICIVGPWLDAYFTRKVVDSLVNPEIAVSFIVRSRW